MNGLRYLPEYVSAEHAYRLERTRIERAPRRGTSGRPHLLRRVVAALAAGRRAARIPATR